MKYKNPYYKKIKKSYLMLISCGYCKEKIFTYQKKGKGRLLRTHIDRIIASNISLDPLDNAIYCPNCREQLAVRKKDEGYYNMIRSSYNTKIL